MQQSRSDIRCVCEMEEIKPGSPDFLILPYLTPVFSFVLENIQILQRVPKANKHRCEITERVNNKEIDRSGKSPTNCSLLLPRSVLAPMFVLTAYATSSIRTEKGCKSNMKIICSMNCQ